ncbi:MAG TPA: hypothetical protein VFO84_07685, partial [Dehalococcoidia bacterium]|nr:hypothetical protein [Dehalococcoidia bacterium]
MRRAGVFLELRAFGFDRLEIDAFADAAAVLPLERRPVDTRLPALGFATGAFAFAGAAAALPLERRLVDTRLPAFGLVARVFAFAGSGAGAGGSAAAAAFCAASRISAK